MNERVNPTVLELQKEGILLVEDGNHGEYRPRPAEFCDQGVAYIRAADMDAGRVLFESSQKITEPAVKRITKGIGAPGDILLSHKGTVGKTALVPEDAPPFVCSPQTTFWRTKDERRLNRKYLYAFMRSPGFRAQLASRAGETDMAPYVSLTSQRGLTVVLPPINDQVGIADALGPLDDKIELIRQMNETLEATARALFNDWLVGFGPTRAKMDKRAPYLAENLWSLFPDRFGDDGLPAGWGFSTLGSLLTVLETGGRPKGGISGYSSGVPSVGAESITGLGKFDFAKTKYVPEDFFKSMNKGRIENRDVLLYKDGGRPGLFEPHVTLFGDGFPFETFAINEHVYRMRVVESFGQNSLYFWLTTDSVQAEMRIKGTGVAIPGLNSTQAKSLSVVVPSRNAAAIFDQMLDPFITRILANCNESRSLAQTRDFLLPRLMARAIRVRDAETIVRDVT